MSFSQATTMARELGYTEPDPRDDLSGTDVARKLLIWHVKPAVSWSCLTLSLNRSCQQNLMIPVMFPRLWRSCRNWMTPLPRAWRKLVMRESIALCWQY